MKKSTPPILQLDRLNLSMALSMAGEKARRTFNRLPGKKKTYLRSDKHFSDNFQTLGVGSVHGYANGSKKIGGPRSNYFKNPDKSQYKAFDKI